MRKILFLLYYARKLEFCHRSAKKGKTEMAYRTTIKKEKGKESHIAKMPKRK